MAFAVVLVAFAEVSVAVFVEVSAEASATIVAAAFALGAVDRVVSSFLRNTTAT